MGEKAWLVSQRLDIHLQTASRQLRDLPVAEQSWSDAALPSDEQDRERMAFRAEWDDTVDRIGRLVQAFDGKALSSEQGARLADLLALLRSRQPDLRRLRLREPNWADVERVAAVLAPQLRA